MSNIDNYRKANELWLEAEQQYRLITNAFHEANALRIERYKNLMASAALLTEDDTKQICNEQYGART